MLQITQYSSGFEPSRPSFCFFSIRLMQRMFSTDLILDRNKYIDMMRFPTEFHGSMVVRRQYFYKGS